jgi:hypothetical protein
MKEVRVLAVLALLAACGTTNAQTITAVDYKDFNAPAADLTTLFGPKVASLDAVNDLGFDFSAGQGLVGKYRNLNVISEVYQAAAPINIGTGVGGNPIELAVGDYTYAYTLDYTAGTFGSLEAPINDFSTIRTPLGAPGQSYADSELIGGGYNTAADFDTVPLNDLLLFDYNIVPDGYDYTFLQYYFPSVGQVLPGDKVMLFLFATQNTTWFQAGGSGFGEGGSIIGGSANLDDIPVLVPVVPEPATALMSGLLGLALLRRRALSCECG